MKGHIAICGPAEPSQIFTSHVDGSGRSLPLGLGGVPINILARELAAAGWRVTVVSTSKHVTQTWSHREGAITVVLVPFRQRPRDYSADFYMAERQHLTAELRASGADLVHAQWTYEFALASIQTRLPLLITAHDSPLQVLRQTPDAYRAVRTAMAFRVRYARRPMTFVSPILADAWRRQMLVRGEPCVIPNIAEIPPSNSQGLGVGQRVISVGQASRLKNIRTLLQSWPMTLAIHPSAELVLVGPGLQQDGALHNWSKSRGFDRSVVWCGPVDRAALDRLYDTALVMAHPSLLESQGQVLLEAMVRGIPIIAGRNSGAVPWTVGPRGATLVDVRSPQELAGATIELLSNQHTRQAFAEQGRTRAATTFSAKSVVSAYEVVYQTL